MVFQAVTNFVATRAYADLNQNKEFVLGSVLSEEVQLGNRLLRRKDPQFFLFEYWPPNYKNLLMQQLSSSEMQKLSIS